MRQSAAGRGAEPHRCHAHGPGAGVGVAPEWPSIHRLTCNSGRHETRTGESRSGKGTNGRRQPSRAESRERLRPSPDSIGRKPELGDRQPEAACALSSHPRRSRREAPGWKDDAELSGSQPGRGISEGRQEVSVALVELPADLPARRVEPRSRGLLEPLGCCMRFLLPNGRRTSGRQIEELALLGSLALDGVDHLRNPPCCLSVNGV
jgi:hypothetical protein